jgi:selenocysteine lyase/cysteine desulfurase
MDDAHPPNALRCNSTDTIPNNVLTTPSLAPAHEKMSLLEAYPEYATTHKLDTLRESQYTHLDDNNHAYLDYTGAGLPARSQLRAHSRRLETSTFGNPHSDNPTSSASTGLVEDARARILAHLNASPDEYAVVFTANATGAARLVGEAYPWGGSRGGRRQQRCVLTADNHNSINGLREFAARRRVRTTYVPVSGPELRTSTDDVVRALRSRNSLSELLCRGGSIFSTSPSSSSSSSACSGPPRSAGLFAYPAQSNFSGVQHPLSWVPLAQARGYDVLLDAAAFLPTNRLDLSGAARPEFVTVSWYKVLGYPTGVGCLVAKHGALARLRRSRPWFAGGTVRNASVALARRELVPGAGAFEDGTVDFLGIPDVHSGLDYVAGVGLDVVATRVRCLTGWTIDRLQLLRHSDGRAMVRIYGPLTTLHRGGTVTFNVVDGRDRLVDERVVSAEAAAVGISLRVGCFCNPGAAEAALGVTRKLLKSAWHKDVMSEDVVTAAIGPTRGGVRVSFGIASNKADVDRLILFLDEQYRDRVVPQERPLSDSSC